MPLGVSGAEQAGDTRLPAVFFSRSLKATLAALQNDLGEGSATNLQNPSLGHIQCLLPEGFTEFDGKGDEANTEFDGKGDEAKKFVKGSSESSSAMQQQKESMRHEAISVETQATAFKAAAVNQEGGRSSHVINDENISGQAATLSPSTDANFGSHDGRDCFGVIKLLAHVAGGTSIQQAVQDQHQEIGLSGETMSSKGGNFSPGVCVAQAGLPERQQPSTVEMTQVQVSGKAPVVVLAVGPEGGWDDSEVAMLTNVHGFQTVTIAGGRTLDTTTAVVSLVSLALDAMQAVSADLL